MTATRSVTGALRDPALDRRLAELRRDLDATIARFPDAIAGKHRVNLRRTLFDVEFVARRMGTGVRLLDVGGGISLFSFACARLGMETVLVDDFSDPDNERYGPALLEPHRAAGVQMIERDVVAESVDFEAGSIDVAVSFHSMEHWHDSPKRLFSDVRSALRPGGLFMLAGPNCVNARKRLSMIIGRCKWSAMSDWYERERFRGHVREPDVGDLRYIGADLGLEQIQVFGRNWLGYRSPHRSTRALTHLADRALRPFPSLCSDIYLVGTPPGVPHRPEAGTGAQMNRTP